MKKRTMGEAVLLSTAFFLTLAPLPVVEGNNAVLSSEVEITNTKPDVLVPGEVNGKNVPYCIHFDPDKWELTKEISNPAAEFAFKRKGEALFAFVIPETTPVPLEMMPEVIVHNATSKG